VMDLSELHRSASERIENALNDVCAPSLREIGPVKSVDKGHIPENVYLDSGAALVGITSAEGDVKAAVNRAMEAIGGWGRALRPGDKILLKPNYNSPDPPPGSTDVEFLAAVVELLRESGYSDIIVGDCSGLLWHPTMDVFQKTGTLQRMKEMGVPLVSFDDGPWVDVPVKGEYLDKVTIPEVVLQCDKIVYLPCMKTHRLARFTMGLKLSVGLLHPALRPVTLHRENLEEKSAELNLAVRPDLIIMDGRVAFITEGPADGQRVYPDFVLVSGDPVAIDVEGVKILKSYQGENLLDMEAHQLPVIRHAARMGMGQADEGRYRVKRV
jgi:uncharacterized protein (DUF362 family)